MNKTETVTHKDALPVSPTILTCAGQIESRDWEWRRRGHELRKKDGGIERQESEWAHEPLRRAFVLPAHGGRECAALTARSL